MTEEKDFTKDSPHAKYVPFQFHSAFMETRLRKLTGETR